MLTRFPIPTPCSPIQRCEVWCTSGPVLRRTCASPVEPLGALHHPMHEALNLDELLGGRV